MTSLESQLIILNKNLNILRQREAKYAGNAPLQLLNEIEDYETAIALVKQTLDGRLTTAELEAELSPLLIVTGDISGSGLAMGNGLRIIINQAESAVDDARQQAAYEKMVLAEAVRRIASDLQDLVSPFATRPEADHEASQSFTIFGRSTLIRQGKLTGTPYKALLDYEISDAPLFFGRRAAIKELFRYLHPGTLTVLHAESGAGKSSLLQAGLSSRLLVSGHLPLLIRPWNQDPAVAIKRTFLPNLARTPGLAQAPLVDFLHETTAILGETVQLYIFLDQFEEFFTELDRERQANFVDELAICLEDPTLPVCWMLALRDEYFGQIATFSPRIRHPFENQYLLQPLSFEEAREVIVEPAARYKIAYEEGLPDRILHDLSPIRGPVSPPELQLVCSALFDNLEPGEKVITASTYAELGAAPGILSNHLHQVLEKNLGPHQREIAKHIRDALITSDQRRALRTLPELVTLTRLEEETVAQVLQLLVEHRLVRVSEARSDGAGGVEGVYELAHDYLLAAIKVDPETQARKAVQELLEREVQSYKRHGTLLDAQKLKIIQSQRQHLVLDEEARELLRRSQANKKRFIQIRVAAGIVLFIVLVVIVVSTGRFDAQAGSAAVIVFIVLAAVATWAFIQRNQAQQTKRIALARSLSAEALNRLDADAELSLYLALAAVEQADIVQVQDTLRQVLLEIRPWHTFDSRSDAILAGAWSPDGRRIALGLRNGDIQLWDVETKSLQTLLTGHTEAVRCLQFSVCGQFLASASALTSPLDFFAADDGAYGAVRLWDVARSQLLGILEGHSRGIFGLAWSPDSTHLATASADGTIRVWRCDTRQETAKFEGHSGKVRSVAWHPRESKLASAGDNGEAFIWSLERLHLEARLAGHQGEVFGVGWHPAGAYLATCGKDGSVRIWDGLTGQMVDVLPDHKSFVRSVSWHRDGRHLVSSAAGNNKVIVWDVETSRPAISLTGHTDWIRSVAWGPDGERLLSVSDDGTARVWQVNDTPGVIVLEGHSDEANEVAWHPGGKLLASGGKDNLVRLWQLSGDESGSRPERGHPVAILSGHTGWIWSVAWRPDGCQLASAAADGTVRLWNLPPLFAIPAPDGLTVYDESAHTITGHSGGVYGAAWSPDGRTLATAGADKTVQLWSGPEGNHLRTLAGHRADVLHVEFSPDGQRLASASADQTIILWDLGQGQPLHRFEGHTNFVWHVTFSPDGFKLASASGDATARVWDVASGEMLTRFKHERPVASVAWNRSGARLASTSDDGAIRVWEVASRQRVGKLTGHNGGVWHAAWSPDDRHLATAAADGLVRLFMTRFEDVLALAKSYNQRELTDLERQHFLGEPAVGQSSSQTNGLLSRWFQW